jgi:hypothetical protein
MIDLFKLLLAVLCPTFVGFVFVSLIVGRTKLLSDLEKLAVSFLLGSGILTLEMLLLGALKIKLNLLNILITTALLLAGPLFLGWKQQALTLEIGSWRKTERFKGFEIPLLALILLRVGFVLFENLIKPVVGVDAFANWSFRANVFFANSSLMLDPANKFFLGGGAVFYPLNIPLLQTWTFLFLGYWNDALSKIFFGLFFVALLTLFYGTVKRSASRPLALLGTYLLTTLPMLVHHAGIEYADLPLAIYFSASALLLFNYLESADQRYLYLSALLAGIGAWTKSEGLPLLMINLVVLGLFYFRSQKGLLPAAKQIAFYFLVTLIFQAPWAIINYVYKIPKSIYQQIEYDKVFANLGRFPVIIDQFYNKMFFYGNWNIAWFVLVIVALLSFSRLKELRAFYSLVYIGLFLAVFAFMYYLTENYVWLLDGTTLNRNMLLIMPLVIYFIAVNLPGLLAPPPSPTPVPKRGKK